MKQSSVVILLIVIGLLLSACSSGILTASGPSDDDAKQVINNEYSPYVTNIVITSKQQCELSANTKAQGVSERWVITYNDLDSLSSPAQQQNNVKITIQKRDGQWVFFNHLAYCG